MRFPAFFVKVFPPEREVSRFGISVGKKVYAKAVHRNRLKRAFARAFLLEIRRLPRADFFITALPEAKKIPQGKEPQAVRDAVNKLSARVSN